MREIPTADELFFSKEAADFLGITVQRLNKLVQTGKIVPLKKNSSGTVFHISELLRRKEEIAVFSEIHEVTGEIVSGMFEIDSPTKQEAVNFSAIMAVLNISEKKLIPSFESFAKTVDVSEPLTEHLDKWSSFFNVSELELSSMYNAAVREFHRLKKDDEIIKKGSQDYPELLAETEEAPRFLYIRGNKSLLYDSRTVALVGSREASEEAKRNTERVAVALGKNGIIIVSGLAKGIDVTAHKTALEHGYRTIAVIGTNLNQYYPNENKQVQIEIEKKGLVISQFSPLLKTERWFFPLRNGVMSGLSRATVVMAAGETSGALVQARCALKQGRLVLIPQNAFSISSVTWPAKFVARGAFAVKSPQEIIERLSRVNLYHTEPDLFDDSLNDLVVAEKGMSYSAD